MSGRPKGSKDSKPRRQRTTGQELRAARLEAFKKRQLPKEDKRGRIDPNFQMPHMNHIHEFIKWKVRFGELFYRCAHPDCSKITEQSLLLGKRSTCAVCHTNTLVLTKEDLKRAKPRCLECSETSAARELRATKEKVAGVLDTLFAKVPQPVEEEEEQLP